MDWAFSLLGRSRGGWHPVGKGESGDLVYRSSDGCAYAKIATGARSAELAGERDRLAWLQGRGVACPEPVDWHEAEEGACLVMTAIAGVPASALSGEDLLRAWPTLARQIAILHEITADQCPFDRSLSLMFGRAADVVSRNAVNPDFLPDEDRGKSARDLLARVESELSLRLDQEDADCVVCHGDPCMPNFMVSPANFQCTGLVDLGRLGSGDRYADLALMVANAGESWTTQAQAGQAFAMLFDTLGIARPDSERLAFYLRLDPLTWG